MAETIPQGEVREVVSDAQREAIYSFDVGKNPVILSHTKSEAERGHGRRIEAGYKGEIDVERPGESVWAYAPEGEVDLSIAKSGFHINLMPRRSTLRSGEKSVVDSVTVNSGYFNDVSVASGSTAGNQILFADDGRPIFIHQFSGFCSAPNANVAIEWIVYDENNNRVWTGEFNMGHHEIEMNTPIPVPAGGYVQYTVYNNSASSVTVSGQVTATEA